MVAITIAALALGFLKLGTVGMLTVIGGLTIWRSYFLNGDPEPPQPDPWP